jgi:spore germination cell wall hydrolase CwlJ-like protein
MSSIQIASLRVVCSLLAFLPLAACSPKHMDKPWEEQTICLSNVVWHEARGEKTEGQRAVLDVVLNRAKAKGMNICSVLTERKQFQWTKHYSVSHEDVLKKALLGKTLTEKSLIDSSYLWFYNSKLKPVWAKKMECKKIGNHNFCKEKI